MTLKRLLNIAAVYFLCGCYMAWLHYTMSGVLP